MKETLALLGIWVTCGLMGAAGGWVRDRLMRRQ